MAEVVVPRRDAAREPRGDQQQQEHLAHGHVLELVERPDQQPVALAEPFAAGALTVWADFDEDRDIDAVLLRDGSPSFIENTGTSGRAFRLSPRGLRDNRRAVGAIVEVRAHGVYRRIFWRGAPQLIGIGSFGLVASALDAERGGLVAVKRLDAA